MIAAASEWRLLINSNLAVICSPSGALLP